MSEIERVAPSKDTARCYVCGPENPVGFRVAFRRTGTYGSVATYVARAEHAGWSGVVHGGVLFSLMDEACGWSLFFADVNAVTARVQTRFHQAVLVGTELLVTATAVPRKRKLYDVHAEIRANDPGAALLAEADATMFEVASFARNF